MLVTIEEFRSRVAGNRQGLIEELQSLTGRFGSAEAHAWDRSFRELCHVFQAPSFQQLHLYFGGRGDLLLEYQLPASGSWCDVVLLGAHESRPAAVILELKDWVTRGDLPGRYEGLILRQGAQELHPSDQVRGYTEYCRRFHSAVAEHKADVHGCVLFTGDAWASAYAEPPNHQLASQYPLFTMAARDVSERFPDFFKTRLSSPDQQFARAFAEGIYRQDRGFVSQIGQQILDPQSGVFELLDNQRTAFAACSAVLREAFSSAGGESVPKRVVVIKGPPGSGKSAIAARLWASLVTDAALPPGDVVFTTTSQSQNSNWTDLFDRSTSTGRGSGVVRRATSYTPVSTKEVGDLRARMGNTFLKESETWRENLALLREMGHPFRDGARDNQNLVSIVDEAHGLINPEHGRGRGQFGFAPTLGPQAYHIIRSSLISVFLLDPLQGFRERENTTLDDIRKWSSELGAGDPVEIVLDGVQFRCAGSAEYVNWLESLLRGADTGVNCSLAKRWFFSARERPAAGRPVGSVQSTGATIVVASEAAGSYEARSADHIGQRAAFDFQIFQDPERWESQLRARVDEGASVRMLSTYARPWRTKDMVNPHALPFAQMDFHEAYDSGGTTRHWSRIWNFVPEGTNYTWFVVGHGGGRIAADPLCEVGCPYAVRGFDYDYVGILWLNDLIWRRGRLTVNPDAVEETGVKTLTTAARREKRKGIEGPATAELRERVAQAYRILFTRALKGVYVWIPDSDTRAHLLASLGR